MFELKHARTGAIAIFCGVAIFAEVISPATAAPPPVLQDTYATAVIGDLPGMINRVAGLGNRINPGISGQALRGQIGMFLGDVDMNSIPAGAGLLVAVPAKDKPYALLETRDGKNGVIAEALQKRGRMAVKASGDNLVIIAKDSSTLDTAPTSAAAELLSKSNEPSLVVTIDTDRLAREKGPDFKRALSRISDRIAEKDAGSSGTGHLLNLFGNIVLAIGQRCDVGMVKVDVSGDGILFDRALYPNGGIHLDKPEGPTGEELRKGLVQPDKVAMSFDYYLDMQSTMKALEPLFSDIMRGPGMTSEDRAELKNMFEKAAAAYGDGMAGWSRMEDAGNRGGFIVTLLNADAALAEINAEMSSFTSGTMAKSMKMFGMHTSGTLTKKSETIEGQPVHNFSIKMDADSGKSSFLTKSYNIKEGQFTFQGDKMLMTFGNESLADLVKAASNNSGNAKPVEARTKLDAGGFMYMDFYPSALAESGGLSKLPPVKKLFDAIGDTAIYQSVYVDQEKLRSELLIPGDMIENVAKAVQQLKRSDTKTTETE